MAIKVENTATVEIKDVEAQIQKAVECLPIEHLRGFGKIRVVDRIEDARLPQDQLAKLPVLYRPRLSGASQASGEIALAILLPSDVSFWKRRLAKAQIKPMIAQSVFSIAAQHHIITVSNRKMKDQASVERSVREYVEKYFKIWRERQGGLRAKLFKPLVPYLERWQKSVRKYYAEQARKKASSKS